MALLVSAFHATQACLSAYTGLLSYTSIVQLQKYEERTEQAAQVSNTAGHQLHKTRTTQASGALNTLCSLTSSIVLTGGHSQIPWRTIVLLSTFNLAASALAYRHMSNFWTAKAKVPFVHDFNDAVTLSNQMLTAFRVLTVTWGISCLLYGWQVLEPKSI